MARKTLPSAPSSEDVMTLAEILKPTEMLPTHDALREDAIRAGFMAELKPSTPYQVVMVSHLVDAEMDIQHVRNTKTGLLRDTLAGCVEEVFERFYSYDSNKNWSDATKAAMDPSHEDHESILDTLWERGLSMNDLVGRAYQKRVKQLAALEVELDRAYRRRQSLRSQFDALARAEMVVEDADVVDG